MADRYWVGGTGNWSDTARWSTASGGSSGASVPTSADNVFFDDSSAAGTFTVTIDTASAVCGAFDASGITNAARKMTLTGTTSVGLLQVNGNWTNPTSTYFAWTTWTGNIVTFAATGTIVTNAVSFVPILTVNGAGITISLGGALTLSSTLVLTNGSVDTTAVNNYAITATGITISANSNTRTLTLNASSVTLTAAACYTDSSTGGYTLSAGTSTITCSAASPTLAGAGKTFYNVTFSSTTIGNITLTGSNTFNNLTFAARAAAGFGQLILTGGTTQTINGTLTTNSGSSATPDRRIRLASGTNLSVATISAAAISLTNTDFRDVTASGAAAPFTGTSLGNCLGNTNITFTVAKTVYWSLLAGGNWNATAWATSSSGTPSAANFPLAQDTCIIDDAGLTTGNSITINANWQFGDIQSTRTTAWTFVGGANNPNVYGSLTLDANVTLSIPGSFNLFSQSPAIQTVTLNGVALQGNMQSLGTLRVNGNITIPSTSTFSFLGGNLDLTNNGAGNYTLTVGTFSSLTTNTRNITFGSSGEIVCASAFTASGSGLTSSGSGTITMTSASPKTFAGGGYSYAATLVQGGAGALTISGNNTFYDITATTLPSTITFTAGTTQTVTQFTGSGTVGNLLTLNSATPGSNFTLSDSGGTNAVSYCSITDSIATGGATWQSFTSNGNVNGGNNYGWLFTSIPDVYEVVTGVELRSMAQRGRF